MCLLSICPTMGGTLRASITAQHAEQHGSAQLLTRPTCFAQSQGEHHITGNRAHLAVLLSREVFPHPLTYITQGICDSVPLMELDLFNKNNRVFTLP